MNTVSPIRDKEMLRRVKKEAEKMGPQPYLLVLLGINTGLRVGDLLQVRVSDIMQRGYIIRREQKTGKQTEIRFSPKVLAELRRLLATRRGTELIFTSPQLQRRGEPIDRMTAYRWIVTACRRAGITEPVGCHTLRKTYGYHFYQQHRDVAMLMEIFNHASEAITMRYIGVTQEQINQKRQNFYL